MSFKEPWLLRNDNLFNAWVSYYYEYKFFIKRNFADICPITKEPKSKDTQTRHRLGQRKYELKKKYIIPLDFEYTLRQRKKIQRKVLKFNFEQLETLYKIIFSKAFIPPNERN